MNHDLKIWTDKKSQAEKSIKYINQRLFNRCFEPWIRKEYLMALRETKTELNRAIHQINLINKMRLI